MEPDRDLHRSTLHLCLRCQKYKTTGEFYTNTGTRSGLTSYCRACYKQYNQRRRKKRENQ